MLIYLHVCTNYENIVFCLLISVRCSYLRFSNGCLTGETPHPVTYPEYIFTIIDILVGMLTFAIIAGTIGSMIENMNHHKRRFNQSLDSAKR